MFPRKEKRKREIESEIKIIYMCVWCNYVNIFELIGIASRNNNIGAAKDFIHIVLRHGEVIMKRHIKM